MICDSDRISIWISIVIIHWIELDQIRVAIEELTDVGEVFLFCLFSVFERMPSKQIWRFFETITFIDMEIQLSTHDCPIVILNIVSHFIELFFIVFYYRDQKSTRLISIHV